LPATTPEPEVREAIYCAIERAENAGDIPRSQRTALDGLGVADMPEVLIGSTKSVQGEVASGKRTLPRAPSARQLLTDGSGTTTITENT
jgi:hypothetical protein